jgi:replicative DNA helicase
VSWLFNILFIMGEQLSFDNLPNFIGQTNVEIEEIVLGTFINYADTYYLLSDSVSVKDFSNTETRLIYAAISELSKISKIDITTVTDMLIKKKYVLLSNVKSEINLISYLEIICDKADSDKNIKDHVKILNGYTQRRELFSLSRNISEMCNDSQDGLEIIQSIHKSLLDIQELAEVEDFNVEKSMISFMDDLESETFLGVKSGIPCLDNFIYQFDLNNLIIIAGAPSMGKTAFALEIFKNNIMNGDNFPIFFSLEMTDLELTKRLISSFTCIEMHKFRDKSLDSIDKSQIKETVNTFKSKSYFIDDKSRKLGKIVNQIRKQVIRHGSKLVVIDYLQLISFKSKSGNREQEIATISRSLKEVAAELKIVIIALSQLNRQVNARTNKRPMLSDLRESGAIEQDADMVIFPYRPAYYEMQDKGIPELETDVEIIIAKGRSTGVGTVYANYVSKYVKFISDFKENAKIQILANSTIGIQNHWTKIGDSNNNN